jgi:myo-inositol-1(or 4)-monophosphatase
VPKQGDDFATEVDIRAEEAIRGVLREHRPRDGVIGEELGSDEHVRSWMSPRVSASTLVLGWVAAGQRAAYASDGDLRHSVHFAAGIALCRAVGCVVSDLSGGDLSTGDGLLIAADQDTWRQLSAHVRRLRVLS